MLNTRPLFPGTPPKAKRCALVLIAVLALVLSQGMALAHTHDGDLNRQFDCELCLKLSAGDDANIAAASALELDTKTLRPSSLLLRIIDLSLPNPSARAPPQISI